MVKLLDDILLSGNHVTSDPRWSLVLNHSIWQRIVQNKRVKLHYVLQQQALNSKVWRNKDRQFWEDVHGINPTMIEIIVNSVDDKWSHANGYSTPSDWLNSLDDMLDHSI